MGTLSKKTKIVKTNKKKKEYRWYEFNDTNVLSFDVKNLEREAFGGKENVKNKIWGLGETKRMVSNCKKPCETGAQKNQHPKLIERCTCIYTV